MELSLIVDMITAAAVVLGLLLGLVQLRHYHISRDREATLFLLNSFQSGELIQGVWMIHELPDGLSKNVLEERIGDEMKLVYLVMSTWERIGNLVFRQEIPIEMVDEIYSLPILITWERLEKFIVDLRATLQRDAAFEWFQWLSERLIDRKKAASLTPAYLAYRDWE